MAQTKGEGFVETELEERNESGGLVCKMYQYANSG